MLKLKVLKLSSFRRIGMKEGKPRVRRTALRRYRTSSYARGGLCG